MIEKTRVKKSRDTVPLTFVDREDKGVGLFYKNESTVNFEIHFSPPTPRKQLRDLKESYPFLPKSRRLFIGIQSFPD